MMHAAKLKIPTYFLKRSIRNVLPLRARKSTSAPTGETSSEVYSSDSSSGSSDDEGSMKAEENWDVAIAGGGIVGAALACALGASKHFMGRKILLLEKRNNSNNKKARGWSNRVFAITRGTHDLLERLDVWKDIPEDKVKNVRKMQIWESCSDALITFNSPDFSETLAYIVDQHAISEALYKKLQSLNDVVTVRNGAKISQYDFPTLDRRATYDESRPVSITLNDETCIKAKLLVGADGFNSQVRKAMHIKHLSWSYHQKAIVATLKLSDPTENTVAWQRFLPYGVIAVLPLTDDLSSLVWSVKAKVADSLMMMDDENFVDALNQAMWHESEKINFVEKTLARSASFLDAMGCRQTSRQLPPSILSVEPGSRGTFPLGLGHATCYVLPRVALVGDAAHRVHPLAGQGANLGFVDVKILADRILESLYNGNELGDFDSLLSYETAAQRHVVPFLLMIEALQKLYSTTFAPVVLARSLGVQIFNSMAGLKERIIQAASA